MGGKPVTSIPKLTWSWEKTDYDNPSNLLTDAYSGSQKSMVIADAKKVDPESEYYSTSYFNDYYYYSDEPMPEEVLINLNTWGQFVIIRSKDNRMITVCVQTEKNEYSETSTPYKFPLKQIVDDTVATSNGVFVYNQLVKLEPYVQ